MNTLQRTVLVTPPAQSADFVPIAHWFAQDPALYRLRPEIGNGIRLATLGSYVILFRVDRDAVLIERIVHGSRDLIGLLENED